jgi:MFS family permease
MNARRSLGRDFGWLWAAYAVSTYGTGVGFGAMAIIAIRVLHAGPGQVSLLSSVGLAAGALLAIPLGPWIEFRHKRPVMVAMDLIRFAAQITIPIAYLLGWLTFVQLLLVTIVVAGARITFQAASGAHLRSLVEPDQLLAANARFESTTWSSLVVGPPLGGAAIGILGAAASVTADAVSYLLSALGIGMIRQPEPEPPRADRARPTLRDLPDSWHYILAHPDLRGPFLNRILVGGLILCTEPLLAVLMLDDLHFQPWQYTLAFAAPCVGGLVGSRLSRRLVRRYGQRQVMRAAGTLTVGWPIGLAFVPAGTPGLLLVMALQLGLVTSMGVLTPVVATWRLQQTAPERIARTLTAWSVSTSAATAVMTALWGVLAELIGLRSAIALAGALALPTPLLLPRKPRIVPATGHVAQPRAAFAELTQRSSSATAPSASSVPLHRTTRSPRSGTASVSRTSKTAKGHRE